LTVVYSKKVEKMRIRKVFALSAPSVWKRKKKVSVTQVSVKGKQVGITCHEVKDGKVALGLVCDPKVAVSMGHSTDFHS
jgi:hypothetical protein